MEANELRIGNITDKGKVVTFWESGIHVGAGKCYGFSEVSGIPISEEILLKVGFEYCDKKSEWLMQLRISASTLYCRSNKNNFYWQFNETYLSSMINYVHNLQNFTNTFGRELDVSKLI